jgi:hypothetical protein
VKNPAKTRKNSVRKNREKIRERRRMRKTWNGKALMRVPKRKRTRIDGSWIRKSVNGKEHGRKDDKQ